MCRSIKPLRNMDHPVTEQEINEAALQYVRKVSGYRKPSKANEEAFQQAINEVAEATRSDCETALRERQKKVEALRASSRVIAEDLNGLTAELANEQVADAVVAVEKAEAAGREATQQASVVASLEAQHKAAIQEVATLREQIVVLKSRVSERKERVTREEVRLAEELCGFTSISERIAA